MYRFGSDHHRVVTEDINAYETIPIPQRVGEGEKERGRKAGECQPRRE